MLQPMHPVISAGKHRKGVAWSNLVRFGSGQVHTEPEFDPEAGLPAEEVRSG